jgi:acyl-CoA synthetase (AMP-forming)/AMP-acid ligase II
VNELGDWSEVSPFGDLLVRGARLHPDRHALVLPGVRYTYAEVLDRALSVARGLAGAGVAHGDHVGLLAGNGIELVEGLFGVALCGAVSVPLHARHKAAEIGYIVANAELTAVLTTAGDDEYVDFTEIIRTALPSLGDAADPLRLELEEAPRLRAAALLCGPARAGFAGRAELDRLAAGVDVATIDEARRSVRVRDTGVLLYTSGTTARPKGCLLSHEAMTRGPVQRARHRFSSGEHDVTWGAGPLFHIGSLAPFLGSVGTAGTYLTDVTFDPGRALALMAGAGVTAAWPWFPAIIQGLIDHPTFDPARLDRLRTMLLIGPPSLHNRVQQLLPAVEVLQACGMTETAGIYALGDHGEPAGRRAETQGRPVPGVEVRIIDADTGAGLGPDAVGEALVRGYCVMDGYHADADKTAAALDAERWLHTGDLYSATADGRLVFHGRLKDMLKVGGENVAALEVEAFLCEHPAIRLAEVVGRPDPRLDEVPVAFVELHPGQAVTAAELLRWCEGRIARYKIPREIHFMTAAEWPMSATKVDKRVLRQRLAAGAAARASDEVVMSR